MSKKKSVEFGMIGVHMAKAKILVVDDEKNILETVKYNLEKAGFRILTAATGSRDAVESPRNSDWRRGCS